MGAQRRERSVLTGHAWGGCLEEVVGILQAERES